MLNVLLSLVMASTAPPMTDASDDLVRMSSDLQWNFLTGLEYRLGGPFIIANLENSELVCRATRACVSMETIQSQLDDTIGASSVGDFLDQTLIGGRPAVALVAIRGGRARAVGAKNSLNFRIAVYDDATRRWAEKDAVMAISPSNVAPRLRLEQLRPLN